MNIEELIKNRKDQLNVEFPPDEVWGNIQKSWKNEKPTSQWWKIAAAVFITLSIGLLLHNISLQSQVDELASLGDISEDYRVMEDDFIAQISTIEAGLEIEKVKSQNDFEWIFQELNTLDEINEMYRKDIGTINSHELTGILIDYYEKKIRLLKKLELEIKRNNKLNENETTDTNSIRM
ncbi:hypothetical protein SAMN05421640_3367 [Ekhidna lutea]|uniref:Uncharacterized protein n=1 Tax=Ekhidna lutea TaxID=447679 RepID=A0A239LNG9_EKHLU|nr:hypothetical protein [Ekhidna lutea]SNT31353.1 hypothetical protein SAMN05421640_3367 [Ekhidna lutea]